MRKKNDRLGPKLATLALVAVVFVVAVVLMRQADGKKLVYDEATREREAAVLSDIVNVGGIDCVPKRNIRTFLIMGIDDTASRGRHYVTGGQSDVLDLLVVDYTNKTYQRLPINRNTICEVRSYDMEWNDLGTTSMQIALAHAVGDGGPKSCENAVEAVSTLLYGQKIDYYIAVPIASIGVVNRLAGGVEVTIEDDFSASDPSLVMGQRVTLTDEQAVTFVRERMSMLNDDTNEARMRRQEAFLESMREKMLARAREDGAYALDVYNTLQAYMTTDMNGKAFSRMVNGLTDCESLGTVRIEGKVGADSLDFSTFEPDPESLRDAVIALFYRPVEKQGEAA